MISAPSYRIRSRADRLSELSRSDFVLWPEAADPECPLFRRYGRESRRDAGTAKTGVLQPIADIDPTCHRRKLPLVAASVP
jgi:hypothetical protein